MAKPCKIEVGRKRSPRHGRVWWWSWEQFSLGRNPGWRLRRQRQSELFAPAFRVGFGLGVARADQAAAAGGGKVGGEPLPERKFVEPGPGREPPRPPPQPGAPGDVPTAGAEGRKDVRLPPGFHLRAEGAQRQIVFEVFEGGFDLGAPEVKLPPLGRGASAAMGAPKITAFAPACRAPLASSCQA